MPTLSAYSMAFDGRVLERGFWLYAWRIETGSAPVVYVGRTGDTSSPYAASPFLRIGAHLSFRANAKANALARQLKKAGLSATSCGYKMVAIGPIFPEQRTMPEHKEKRDIVGALEAELAAYLTERGYRILGTHPKRVEYDARLWKSIKPLVDESFPRANVSPN